VSRAVSPLASPRLARLASGSAATEAGGTEMSPGPGEETSEQCELCGLALPDRHRHMLDLDSRQLLCACRACSLLFDRPAAGGGHLRLVPERRRRLSEFQLDDQMWAELQIPVQMAFFHHDSRQGRVKAFYPGPMGATESRLELTAWSGLEGANPVLTDMTPDVEALLVNRARGLQGQWLVPIDDCYRLVAVIRTGWRGFTGGKEVWSAIEQFFADLDRRAAIPRPVGSQPDQRKETAWQT
jgi:Family of unknown function (DUF5947)